MMRQPAGSTAAPEGGLGSQVASDGAQALTELARERFDLVLMDGHLSKPFTLEALRTEIARHLPRSA
jgi:CheY-like chemotaxis protein